MRYNKKQQATATAARISLSSSSSISLLLQIDDGLQSQGASRTAGANSTRLAGIVTLAH